MRRGEDALEEGRNNIQKTVKKMNRNTRRALIVSAAVIVLAVVVNLPVFSGPADDLPARAEATPAVSAPAEPAVAVPETGGTAADSSYTKSKNEVDRAIALFETDCGIRVDQVIENAYTEHSGLIDQTIVTPALVKLLILRCGRNEFNSLGLTEENWNAVSGLLQANGAAPLPRRETSEAGPSILAGMVHAATLAQEKGYTAEERHELFADYCLGVSDSPLSREELLTLFYNTY